MRTIRFRGKRLVDGEWEFGWLFHDQVYDGFSFANDVMVIRDENDSDYCVKKETVGQFTGITDKNGKEIYEGDIVRYFANGNAEIKFYKGCWVVMGKDGYDSFDSLCGYIEVIGNIHENPELLESK